jgi:exodeoxyribonuclease V alpha subunit
VAVNRSDAAAARQVLEAGHQAAERIRAHAAQPGDAERATVASRVRASPADAVALAWQGRPGTAASGVGYRQVFEVLRGQRPAAGDAAGFEAWAMAVLHAFDRSRLLCAVREGDWGVAGLNAAIEAEGRRLGLIGRGATGSGPGAAQAGEWYEGRPVMVTRNDPALGVHNGDIGLALTVPGAAPGEPLRVYFAEGDRPRGVMASRLAAIETAWAMTVHKSQGSEFGHTVLALPPELNPVLTRELVYTGITRAREAFTLLLPEPTVFDAAVLRRTRRASGLRERLI